MRCGDCCFVVVNAVCLGNRRMERREKEERDRWLAVDSLGGGRNLAAGTSHCLPVCASCTLGT